jgi:hypothetical protein
VEADDVLLRRVERTAAMVCGATAAGTLLLSGGRPGPAVAVLAGGLLAGVSYHSLKAGVSSLVRVTAAEPADRTGSSGRHGRSRVSAALAKVVVRYALLALLAYVMIARLRLHPLGLLAGVSSVVAAVSLEALRLLMKKS